MKEAQRGEGPAAEDPRRGWGQRLERLCLTGLVALLVATPLVPSEAVAQHDTGTVLVTLWCLLLPAWVVCRLLFRSHPWQLGWTTLAVLAFLALHTLSGLLSLSTGNPRHTINMVWQWLSFGIAFFLTRQLVPQGPRLRAVVAMMLALAVSVSALGGYQYFVTLPQNRAEYERDPEGTLRRIGVEAPPGSLERRQIEDRLYSLEPTATFALTNSLAGFLAPLLVLAAGVALENLQRLRRDRGLLLASLLTVLIVGGCLLVTKSRTALLAALVGGVLLAALIGGGRRGAFRGRLRALAWPLAIAAGGLLLVLIGVLLSGGLDVQVLSEAPKSFLYRLEYWQATLRMIAESPWLGCGPGNFQACYTRYKLPQASETVADPHNFLLEVWATAGTPALLGLVAIGLAFLGQLRSAGGRTAGSPDHGPGDADGGGGTVRLVPSGPAESNMEDAGSNVEEAGSNVEEAGSNGVAYVYAGGLLGLLLAYPCGWLIGFPLQSVLLPIGLGLGTATLVLLHGWVRHGQLTAGPLVCALAVLLINLLAAGGASFPGVALPGWLLLALSVNAGGNGWRWRVPLPLTACLLLGTLLLAAACLTTLYNPVLERQAAMARAGQMLAIGNAPATESALRAAVQADPYSSQPWMQLADLYQRLYRDSGDAVLLEDFQRAVAEIRRLDSQSSSTLSRIGDWYLAVARRSGDGQHLRQARDAYAEAVRRYPHGNLEWAQLAWSSYLVGDRDAAREQAAEALRLDALLPHQERRLDQRMLFVDRLPPSPADSLPSDLVPEDERDRPARPLPSAEQRMQMLRTLEEQGDDLPDAEGPSPDTRTGGA